MSADNQLSVLKEKLKEAAQHVEQIYYRNVPNPQVTINKLKILKEQISNNKIRIGGDRKVLDEKKDAKIDEQKGNVSETVKKKRGRPLKHSTVVNDPLSRSESDDSKKSGRAPKQSSVEEHPPSSSESAKSKKSGRAPKQSSVEYHPPSRSESVDSNASTSSHRSRRAAAQAAEQKLAEVQSYMKATKLRRPTDYGQRQSRRDTHVSSSSKNDNIRSEGKESRDEGSPVQNHQASPKTDYLKNKCLKTDCVVDLKSLTNSVIKAHSTKSRSSAKRKTSDLFSVNDHMLENTEETARLENRDQISKEVIVDDRDSNKMKKKKLSKNKALGDAVSSSLEELSKGGAVHNSPLSEGEFKGFSEVLDTGKRKNTFVLDGKVDHDKNVLTNKSTESLSDKPEESPEDRARTRVIRKHRLEAETLNVDALSPDKEIKTEKEDSPHIRSRTRVIKKDSDKENLEVVGNVEVKEEIPDADDRARTRVIRKHCEPDNTEEEDNVSSRTKTIRKEPPTDVLTNLNYMYLAAEFKQSTLADKQTIKSPAPPKGELIKKRVEDFEKMQNAVQEEVGTGRVTRNNAKQRAAAQGARYNSRENVKKAVTGKKVFGKTEKRSKIKDDNKENVSATRGAAATTGTKPGAPSSVEGHRLTPLGASNRTPHADSTYKMPSAQKGSSHHSRHPPAPPPGETNVATVQRQALEEAEMRQAEREMQKRKAKEEDAKKKKERTLRATSEETRKKREERLLKVAAVKEAQEKEKMLLAAKAEKEKEEKLRQIAAEKEKHKKEQLKKKQLLQQQKAQELEERRRQEEAARMAKLKEQEEEHKRLLATKERDMELQKHRLAEAEKAKHQHHQKNKLAKLAAANNAKLQQAGTPCVPPATAQGEAESYEITPSREDRPLLEPKSENDYGIDDANSGDSTDDEETQPKKKIPLWAQPQNREHLIKVTSYLPKEIWGHLMEKDTKPDVTKIFAGTVTKSRVRTSSAVWNTPPQCSHFSPN